MNLKEFEFWFLTGSQDLYGPETLKQVEAHSRLMAEKLNTQLPALLVYKPVLKSPAAIRQIIEEANATPACAGIITWMHTFSPAKMWIAGLSLLSKPLLHLHTQFNRDIPWDTIDMDFMNLNQSAHGDREHGYIGARLRLPRKVVVGHWEEAGIADKIGIWMRAACALSDGRHLKVMRFGDNMREVAVTEGDKVDAQVRYGWSVNGYGLDMLSKRTAEVESGRVEALLKEYRAAYEIPTSSLSIDGQEAVREQARIEIALRSLLEETGAKAFTTTFEDLHGLKQLPGLAVQRLMADGYGFGAEGDWKTAALVRAMKVMSSGLEGGTSFMEDYTYHFEPDNECVLGAHMLEVCPSIARHKPQLEVHPLAIGGKSAPARLVFDGCPGAALNASLIDMGGRFRLIVNTVSALEAIPSMPRLPVARVLWRPHPDLRSAAEAWILAGGAHHTAYTTSLSTEYLEDYATMSRTEILIIDEKSDLRTFRREIHWNDQSWNNY